MADVDVEPKTPDRRVVWGWWVTGGWLISAAVFGFTHWDSTIKMGLHDAAETAAGIFGPLAFLWLVLGYLLQSDELKLQREQLTLQRSEVAKLAVEAELQRQAIERQTTLVERDALIRLIDLIRPEQAVYASRILKSLDGEIRTDAIWAQYAAGDVDTFFHRAARILASGPEAVVRANQSEVFGFAAPSFLRNFERILTAAQQDGGQSQILEFIEYSPMADLYAAICRAGNAEIRFSRRRRPASMAEIFRG